MATVTTIVNEAGRGCGFRKRGGLYLRADGLGKACGLFPMPLTVCPCCGAGFPPARGWTWIDFDKLSEKAECAGPDCGKCPARRIGRAGMLWVGEMYYATPEDFTAEAAFQGVSRRVSKLPKGFQLGKTWVLLAHRKAVLVERPTTDNRYATKYAPGIFHAFKPTRVEYVVRGDETEQQLDRMERRGISLVKLEWTAGPQSSDPDFFLTKRKEPNEH